MWSEKLYCDNINGYERKFMTTSEIVIYKKLNEKILDFFRYVKGIRYKIFKKKKI